VQPPRQADGGGATAIDNIKRKGRRATIFKNANEPKKPLNEPVVLNEPLFRASFSVCVPATHLLLAITVGIWQQWFGAIARLNGLCHPQL